jgi:acyl carrier protein
MTNPMNKEEALTEQTQFGFEDLKRILVDRVGLNEDDVKDDPSTTFDEMGLDSLAFVEIQLAMEQEYGITVGDEDAESIHTVGEAIEFVNAQLAEQG